MVGGMVVGIGVVASAVNVPTVWALVAYDIRC